MGIFYISFFSDHAYVEETLHHTYYDVSLCSTDSLGTWLMDSYIALFYSTWAFSVFIQYGIHSYKHFFPVPECFLSNIQTLMNTSEETQGYKSWSRHEIWSSQQSNHQPSNLLEITIC